MKALMGALMNGQWGQQGQCGRGVAALVVIAPAVLKRSQSIRLRRHQDQPSTASTEAPDHLHHGRMGGAAAGPPEALAVGSAPARRQPH